VPVAPSVTMPTAFRRPAAHRAIALEVHVAADTHFTSSHSDRAFTPRPDAVRPPRLYTRPANLPPACSLVMTVSSADLPVCLWMSTGMRGPVLHGDQRPSLRIVNGNAVAVAGHGFGRWSYPLRSRVVQRLMSVPPIYMPGRRPATLPALRDLDVVSGIMI